MNKSKNIGQIVMEYLSALSVTGILLLIPIEYLFGLIMPLQIHLILLFFVSILFLITLITTITWLIDKGLRKIKFMFYIHLLAFFGIALCILYTTDVFRSKKVLDIALIDDLSRIDIEFRENGCFETTVSGILFFERICNGKYHIKRDTIFFIDKPYDNDFIPDTLIIDRDKNAIFFNRDSNGEFNREKTFLNYFEIKLIDLHE
ncbi:MAG: hypothetical protein N4A72_21205 [Bacteroidales bacterium]|jgi:hypothetical protein|nr:hypothetical protein [Bacteroidales bacterium]